MILKDPSEKSILSTSSAESTGEQASNHWYAFIQYLWLFVSKISFVRDEWFRRSLHSQKQ